MTEENIIWDLNQSFFKGFDDPEIQEYIDKANNKAKNLLKWKMLIQSPEMTPEKLVDILKESEEVSYLISRPYIYAMLSSASNAQNKKALELYSRMVQNAANLESELNFIGLELGELLTKRPKDFLESPVLIEYKHTLEKTLREHPYKLSENEEKIIIEKDLDGTKAWNKLQEEWLSNREFEVTINGETKTVPFGKYKPMIQDPDPAVRQQAIKNILGSIGKDAELYAAALRAVCGNHLRESKRRGYKDAMEPSFLLFDVTRGMIDALMQTVEGNAELCQNIYRLKAKSLGTEKLKGADFEVPVPGEDDRVLSWQEGVQLVIDSYKKFDPEIGEIVEYMVKNNRIDASPRVGKRAGAFCMSDFGSKSAYVLISYNGSIDDTVTLAHELGHGIHATLSNRQQNFTETSPPMVIAETASIFGEMIIIDRLIQEAPNDKAKRTLLFNQLLRLAEVIFEVGSRVFIEQGYYDTIEKGEYLDSIKASEIFFEGRKRIYGDLIEWEDEQKYEWCWKPHYYFHDRRFYNYPYVFAQMVVLSLYAKYKQEGASFIPKYKEFLSAGGSISPLELGKKIMNVDMADPNFWELGMNEVKRLYHELEKLI